MSSHLVCRFRCLQSPQTCFNIIRPNIRSVHKGVVHCQDGSKEPPAMPEYRKKRERLLASNPVQYSTTKPAKFEMMKKAKVAEEKPAHRNISCILSFTVLFLYLWYREENDLDENISYEGKTAEEFQAFLDKLKEKKEGKKT